MNFELVIFAFFIILAAFVVNAVVTVLKFGDRTQVGATHLATSLVALLQLATAAVAAGRYCFSARTRPSAFM